MVFTKSKLAFGKKKSDIYLKINKFMLLGKGYCHYKNQENPIIRPLDPFIMCYSNNISCFKVFRKKSIQALINTKMWILG